MLWPAMAASTDRAGSAPERELAGHVALVTGGAGAYIGGPAARGLALQGADIAICDIHQRRTALMVEALEKETGRRILGFPLDIADRKAVDHMIAETEARLGPVDVLVNNAAENVLGPLRSFDPKTWDRLIEVDLSACFYLIRKVMPGMVERGRGNIINITSVAAWMAARSEARGEAAYACSKAALHELTRSVAAEGGPYGVRCNAIAPGIIWSKFVQKHEARFRPELERTPLRRFGTSEDMVEAILFFASNRRSGFVTGEILNVSGGWYMRG